MEARTDLAEALLGALRTATGQGDLRYATPPVRIPSGHETDVYAVELPHGTRGCPRALIARCFPSSASPVAASLEAAVHEGLAAQAFPVPRVIAVRDAPPAFLAMERLPGRSLNDGIELGGGPGARLSALAALMRLSVQLPRILGGVTARLLACDVRPVLDALEARGLAREALGFERHLADLARRIEGGALPGLAAGLDWLHRARPSEPERLAICHGDLAPNLLLEGARVTGVIDWSSHYATITDPAFEVANSRFMIQVPLPLPLPLRPPAAAYQRSLSRRYERAVGAAIEPGRLRYYEAWRGFRALVGAAELWLACADGAPFPDRPDPWKLPEIAPLVARGFEERTGVAVELPDPPGR